MDGRGWKVIGIAVIDMTNEEWLEEVRKYDRSVDENSEEESEIEEEEGEDLGPQ